MADLINIDLSKIKKEHLLIGCIVLIITIALLAYQNIFKPLSGRISDTSAQIQQKENAIQRAKTSPQALENIEKEMAQIQSKVDSYQQKLEGVADVPKILRDLNQIAELQRIRFVSVTPMERKQIALPGGEEFILQVPIRIKLQCGYHTLGIFINQIENFPRLMKVTDLRITADTKDVWSHQVELAVSSYGMVSKEELQNK